MLSQGERLSLLLLFFFTSLFSFPASARALVPATNVVCFDNLSDTHITSKNYLYTQLTEAIQYLNSTIKPTLNVITGDLVENATEDNYKNYRAAIDLLNKPEVSSAGNHDLQGDRELFKTKIGPFEGRLDQAGYRFIWFNGYSDPVNWLAGQLAQVPANLKPVVLSHDPLNIPASLGMQEKLMNANWRDRIKSLLKTYKVVAYLSGHTHESFVIFEDSYSLLNIGAPSTTKKRKLSLICLDNGAVSRVDLNFGQTPVALITSPEQNYGKGRGEVRGLVEVRVKAFSAKTIKSAQYRVDSGAWQNLSSVGPAVGGGFYETNWNSSGVSLGKHSLEAKIIDSAGASATHKITVNLVASPPLAGPTPSPIPVPLLGDFNHDYQVNIADYVIFVVKFQNNDPLCDLNQSGAVDDQDFQLFLSQYGK